MKTNVRTISVSRMTAELLGYALLGIAGAFAAMAGCDAIGLTDFNTGGPILQLIG